MRVCFALTSPVRGGVEEVVLALLQRLDPREFQTALAAPAPLLDALAPDLAGVRVDTTAVRAESWLEPRELGRLDAFFRRWCPDIVNAHLFRSTAVAAPLARLAGVPRVVETYHGREGWRQGRRSGNFVLDRLVARFCDRVIAVSEAAARFLVEGKGYPAAKVVVVPNGRDLSAFAPGGHRDTVRKELGIDRVAPVVGVVGRLETQKGHRYLFAAWPAVVREYPDARLLVIGDGSLRAELEGQVRSLGLADSVVFLGFRSDIPRLLDTLDGLALPSLYEGMPLTVIEASAMACPVVATAVDGTPEVIDEDVTGWLVPPADPPALGRALVRMLADPERARAVGRAGRERVLRRFDLATQVEATARVYRSVLGEPRR
ncbi:MAG: glycosyltransferase family 4 protein [Candidatus Rokubacteria bacterium]|nr:glycosyltransferase family 4 protein [Candidatus Rokubacteria bacterium]